MKTIRMRMATAICLSGFSLSALAAVCSAPDYSASTQYKGGELVTYANAEFKAKYWVKGTSPDKTQQWGPWQFLQDCTSGEPVVVNQVSPVSQAYTRNAGTPVSYTLQPGTGASFTGLAGLTQGSQYTVSGSTVTLVNSYVDGLNAGLHTYAAQFSAGSAVNFGLEVTVPPQPPEPPQPGAYTLNPAAATLSAGAELSGSLIKLKHGVASWSYSAPATGTYDVAFVVAAPSGDKPITFNVDGNSRLTTVGGAGTTQTVLFANLSLAAGSHTVVVDGRPQTNWGYIDVLGVNVTPVSEPLPQPALSPTSASFDLAQPADVSFSLNTDGDSLTGVSLDGVSLASGAGYQHAGSTLTIAASSLSGYQKDQVAELTVNFNQAAALSASIAIADTTVVVDPPAPVEPGFVYVTDDGHFGLDGNYFYTNGANSYIPFYKHEQMVRDLFASAQKLEMTSFRTWAFCDGEYYGTLANTGLDGEVMCFQPKNPEGLSDAQRYSEATFKRMDFVIEEARKAGLKLILPLTNYWGGFGGMCQYAYWSPDIVVDNNGDGIEGPEDYLACYRAEQRQRGVTPPVVLVEQDGVMVEKEDYLFLAEANAQYYGDAWSRARFKEYITYFLNRVNHITGVAYKDDPTIMMWELANEPRCIGCSAQQKADFHDWINDISSHIKAIDNKHLVSTGTEGFDAENPWEDAASKGKDGNDFVADHNFPHIDAMSFHVYPDWWGLDEAQTKAFIASRIDKARAAGKPVYMGEYGRMIQFDAASMKSWMHWDGRDGIVSAERDRVYSEWLALADQKDLDGAMMWILSDTDFWEIPSAENQGGPYCDTTAGPLMPCDGLYNDWDRFTIYCNETYQYDAACDLFRAYSQKVKSKNGAVANDGSPVARFSVSGSLTENQPVAFDAGASSDSDGTLVNYLWNFGDGSSTSGAMVSHSFAAGTYTVQLTVMDDQGKTGNLSQQITVQPEQPAVLDRIRVKGQDVYLNGYNIAWFDFANDVGNGINETELRRALQDLVDSGGNTLRWWMHTDGAYTPAWSDINGQRQVSGPGGNFIADLKQALDIAQEYQVYLVPSLWSFDMLRYNNVRNNPTLDNYRLLTEDAVLQSYIDAALVPMVQQLNNHPSLAAWELFNEPENMTESWFEADAGRRPSLTQLQRVQAKMAAAIHRAAADLGQVALVTTGSKSMGKYNSDVAGGTNLYRDDRLIAAADGDPLAVLDFYQPHYYNNEGKNGAWSPFHHDVSYWGVNKPIVVGEFYVQDLNVLNDPVLASDLCKKLHQRGYAGGWSWQWNQWPDAVKTCTANVGAGGGTGGGDTGGGSGGGTGGGVDIDPIESTVLPHTSATLTGATDEGSYAEVKSAGSSVIWHFNITTPGEYRITLTYSTPYGSKANTFVVDGVGISQTFDSITPATVSRTVTLDAGAHSAGLMVNGSDWGYMAAHSLTVELLGGLTISSPQNFDQLPSGSDILVNFVKTGNGALTYTVNSGAIQRYEGASPLVIPTNGDGTYRLVFGLEGTQISHNLRVNVGQVATVPFVETAGTQFVLGNKPFYFNGSNQYYLMYKPEAQAADFFKRAALLGLNAVRTWMFCNDTKTHDGVCINMKVGDDFILSKAPANRTASEQAIIKRSFELFDNYVALAEQHNIKLVLSLADHWNFFGNIDSYGGYANAAGREKFKAFITHLVNHVNQQTGVAYKDDPTIMMWELANEPRINSDLPGFTAWVQDIAAHLKAVAPNQLVSIGMESSFEAAGAGDSYANLKAVNSDPNVDAISAHLYPTWWGMTDAQTLGNFDKLADLARELNKPAYIGEFSWPVNEISTGNGQTTKLNSFTNQTEVDNFVQQSLAQRTSYFTSWYAKAWEQRDAIGGMLGWQLSGLEWGNGLTPQGGCQWCSGEYGVYSGGWSGNNDGFQYYCVVDDAEYAITGLGAPGTNMEGNTIHLQWHKPVCDLIKDYSVQYRQLNQ